MNRTRLTDILTEQLKQADDTIRILLMRIEGYERQLSELTATVKSLEEALRKKDEAVARQENRTRGLLRSMKNRSEKVDVKGVSPEPQSVEACRSKVSPKDRGNNGARRDRHMEMEEERVDVYPDDPSFDMSRAREMGVDEAVRYEIVPMKVRKTVYLLHKYAQDGTIYKGRAPRTPLLNSCYTSSFMSWAAYLRYRQSVPVERIAKMLSDSGFKVTRSTLNGLLSKTGDMLEPLHEAMFAAVKEDGYLSCDETYHDVLIQESPGKAIRKGYIWGISGRSCGLVYFKYRNGSRSGDIPKELLSGYEGTIQSDGYAVYKNLGPGIVRLSCLQHCKRKFLDQTDDPAAKGIADKINELYIREHRHRIGEDGWTADDNLRWRMEYAPPILKELRAMLESVLSSGRYPKDSLMRRAANYMITEWDGIENIFSSGEYSLDNNGIERQNRRISLSRRNSLFFGSHRGAERGTFFFSLVCSCSMNGINFQEYLTDIIDRLSYMQPGTPMEKYRELLPDRWNKAETEGD